MYIYLQETIYEYILSTALQTLVAFAQVKLSALS